MTAFKNDRGTWTVKFYYKDWTGSKKQKKKEGFKTKREAVAYEQDFLNKCESDIKMTFKSLVSMYMEDCKVRLKITTWSNKKFLIDTKIIPYFGNMILSDISVADVRSWQNKLMSSESNYSLTYLKTIHNQLSAIFNFAVKYYGLRGNPAAECGAMGKKKADTMLFWTKDEFDRFIQCIADKPLSYVVFTLLFYSGMREGELLALTYNDFDIDTSTVSITKNYARYNGQDIIMPPKTPKSRRTVALPIEVTSLVKEYYEAQYAYSADERLFLATKSYLRREMDRGCNLSGVKRIRIHDLRHSHASLLIELGVPPILIQERLGHENVETTLDTYSHLYPNKQREVADTLSGLMKL